MAAKVDFHQHTGADGEFRRKPSTFRDTISREPGAKFPPESGRYALYINAGCPWAHRAWIVHGLKGLEGTIQLVKTGLFLATEGWEFDGSGDSEAKEPLYGLPNMKQLYLKADSRYEGRFTVPVLWDKKTETIVNNESSEIIRMFYAEFDDFAPKHLRESSKSWGGFRPSQLVPEIDELNEWVYNTVNNGVYKTGFATTQKAYESHVFPLFKSLDRLEEHLKTRGTPYLFGDHLTEADIRLYTTLARFDVAYYVIFKCNLKMIRHDYPNLHKWLRTIYWDEGPEANGGVFKKTSNFYYYKLGYLKALPASKRLKEGEENIVPVGPYPDMLPL